MKAHLILLLSAISLTTTGQDSLSLVIKDRVQTQKFNCRNATVMDVCKTSIYNTDRPELLYKINYDIEGRIHSQGPVIKEEIDSGKKKHEIEYFETGTWQYFDYEKNEIIYFECVYSNNPGCKVVKKDELKREKIY